MLDVVKIVLVGFFSLLLVYLGIVWVWASAVAAEVIQESMSKAKEVPPISGAGLCFGKTRASLGRGCQVIV